MFENLPIELGTGGLACSGVAEEKPVQENFKWRLT